MCFQDLRASKKANLKNPNTHKPTDATQKELKDYKKTGLIYRAGADATQKELKAVLGEIASLSRRTDRMQLRKN